MGPLSFKDVLMFFPVCFLGGVLTGYIGIGIEKFLFCLLTSYYGFNIRSACCTSIFVVGLCSMVSFAVHASSPRDQLEAGYVGAVPFAEWSMGMSGLLCGTLFGPWLSSAVGPKNILWMFCIILTFTSSKEFLTSIGVIEEAVCIPLDI